MVDDRITERQDSEIADAEHEAGPVAGHAVDKDRNETQRVRDWIGNGTDDRIVGRPELTPRQWAVVAAVIAAFFLVCLVYDWWPKPDGRTRVQKVKDEELVKTLVRLSHASAETERLVQAKRWQAAATSAREAARLSEDALFFGSREMDEGRAEHLEAARRAYWVTVSSIERNDWSGAEKAQQRARKQYLESEPLPELNF